MSKNIFKISRLVSLFASQDILDEPNLSGHLPPDRQTAPGHHGHDGRGVPQRGQHHRQAASRRHGLAAGAEQVLLEQEEGRDQEQGTSTLQNIGFCFVNIYFVIFC